MIGAYGTASTPLGMPLAPRGATHDITKVGVGAFIGLGALLLLMPFVLVPLLIKPFAPKWSYGKRVALGLLISLSLGAIRGIAKAGRKK